MPDLLKAVLFVTSQCALAAVIFSPLILRNRAARGWPTTGSPSGLRLCGYLLPMAAVVGAALVNVSRTGPDGGTGGTGLFAEVLAGHRVDIRLDPAACLVFDLGSIACASDYAAVYDREGNSWTVSGIERGSGARFTATATNAEPVPGALSIWGLLARFEADGTIDYAGQAVGRLTLDHSDGAAALATALGGTAATPRTVSRPVVADPAPPFTSGLRQRAFAGDPVVFALDAESCGKRNWGDLTCGDDYQARYAPATNQWTVSGPQGRGGSTVSRSEE
ncbi:MAG: hypothetical protein JO213_00190, partial [Alphaproteobacteria bacterium]|nr:hypothetical protein [Alphaproteobacteria bacterium]